jgi:hypothetical protein
LSIGIAHKAAAKVRSAMATGADGTGKRSFDEALDEDMAAI